MNHVRVAVAGLGAGLIAGLLALGLGGRLVMSVIALLVGGSPGWTAGGTLEVVLLGTIIGSLGGLLFAGIRRFLPTRNLVRGLLFGAVVLLLVAGARLPSVTRSAAAFDHLTIQIVALFSFVFLAYGILLGLLFDRWRHRMDDGAAGPEAGGVY